VEKSKTKLISRQLLYAVIGIVLTFAYFPNIASAAQITPRKVTLGSSVPSALTTYTFNFTVPQTTVIKSVSFTGCTTASGTCTPAAGFANPNASALASQPTNLGDAAGWAVDTTSTGVLKLNKSGDVAAPTGSQTVAFSNVLNPSALNSTFFIRIATFSDAAYTNGIDSGVVATSTAGQITVTASVDETLIFTLATATVAMGTLTTSSTGIGTSAMTVGTNGSTGYSVVYTGNTLKSGTNSITAMTGAASLQNNSQFGINLMSNTTPAVGVGVSGTGSGTASAGYGTANSFKFNTGDTVATATVPTNTNVFTTSYIANINAVQAAGAYSTVITYTATANF
jgi:hypothetical protein